jgi:signal transduction histidine kinase
VACVTRLDLGEVVEHAAAVAFARSGCTHSLDIRATVWVRARRSAVERAILCLLDNAKRAAGEGGHVELRVTDFGGRGRVQISDDGPGLGRLTPQHSLGLPTVRAVLADCGGTFSLRNGDHGGAVATMEVPLIAWTVAS